MATSGQTILQVTRDEIINAALRKLMVIGEGQTANAAQLLTGAAALNAITSEFTTLGMSIWKRTDYLLPLVNGQSQYTFGVGQPVNTPFPLKVYQARVQVAPDYYTEIEMNQMAFNDYNLLPNGSFGTPVNFNYQPKINLGVLSIWPTPDTSVPANSRLILTYQVPFDVFVNGTDTPDFPQEWANALIYTLAANLADEYGVPDAKRSALLQQADRHLSVALSAGSEEASMFIQRDWAGYPANW